MKVSGELNWRYRHEVEGQSMGVRCIDAGEYFSEWGAAMGRDEVEGLEASASPVSLCWGSFPWMKNICQLAIDAADIVGAFGRLVRVVNVQDLEEWWGMDDLDEGEEWVAFVNVCGNVRIDKGKGKLTVDTSSLNAGDLAFECWWQAFEDTCADSGWNMDGDEGDGTQGWLIHESTGVCDNCGGWESTDSPLLPSGLCAECGDEDLRADESRGAGS